MRPSTSLRCAQDERAPMLLLLLVLLPVAVRADGPKNLQVLPKTSTRAEVRDIMKAQSKALGVECEYCHDVPDMASDKNENKKVARQMMRMTTEINQKWFRSERKEGVTCYTCHHGHTEPPKK